MSGQSLVTLLTEFSETWSPVDFMLAAQHWNLFLTGLRNTLILLAGPLALACLFAIPLAIARANRVPVANPFIFAYTYLFRGTPLLVQLYLLYYGAAQFSFIRDSFLWNILREAWWCAFISFTPSVVTFTPSFSIPCAASSQFSRLREQITMLEPASASPVAICNPRPVAPPVTTLTRPLRSNRFFTLAI